MGNRAALVVFNLMPPARRLQSRSMLGDNFLARWLDPIDRLSETIFSVLILLTFTLAFSAFRQSADPNEPVSSQFVIELLLGALGATLAWGLIDGVMYAMIAVFERGEKHRLLVRIQTALTQEEGLEAIAEELDHILEPIARLEKRRLLYTDILEHLQDSAPQPVKFTRQDLTGALGCVLVALIAVLPSLTPLVLLGNYPALAIRLSNVVSFCVLFYTGYLWGKHSGSNPWKTGLLLLVMGVVLVLIAIPLGG